MNTQSNTQPGAKPFPTLADLTGKEGYVARLVDGGSGKAALALPAATTNVTPFVITEVESPTSAVGTPLTTGKNSRVRLKGTCSAGDYIGLAPGADLGKGIAVSAADARYFGIAEEDGVDGQLLLLRPITGII